MRDSGGWRRNCPFPDCGRVIDGDEVKRQAQAGQMGEQLYTVVFKRRIMTKTKTGKRRDKVGAGLPCAAPEDDNSSRNRSATSRKTA